MGKFDRIQKCGDISEEDLVQAAADRSYFRDLVTRLAEIARPAGGAVKVLLVCSRVVTSRSTWVEGSLRVQLSADDEGTRVEFLNATPGLVERLFSPFIFRVPLAEFAGVARKSPHLIAPLRLVTANETICVLIGRAAEEDTQQGPLSLPPPPPSSAEIAAAAQRTDSSRGAPSSDAPSSEALSLPASRFAAPKGVPRPLPRVRRPGGDGQP